MHRQQQPRTGCQVAYECLTGRGLIALQPCFDAQVIRIGPQDIYSHRRVAAVGYREHVVIAEAVEA